MTRRFIVLPLAEADLEDAARWYEDERAGLAERFFSDVDRTFARIRERPLQFPTVSGDVRRALLPPSRTLFTSGRRTRSLLFSRCCT
jgi:plasmid stabilization system protein ParE